MIGVGEPKSSSSTKVSTDTTRATAMPKRCRYNSGDSEPECPCLDETHERFKRQLRELSNTMNGMNEAMIKDVIAKLSSSLRRSNESQEVAAVEAPPASNPARAKHPLENELILQLIMEYGNGTDLLLWRQVSQFWNFMATKKLLKIQRVSLKNNSTLEYPHYRNTSIQDFMEDVSLVSPSASSNHTTLFPVTRFAIKMMPVPNAPEQDMDSDFTLVSVPFATTYFPHITDLNLCYSFQEHFEENIPARDIDDSIRFIQPKYLPNLESLTLHMYHAQMFADADRFIESPQTKADTTQYRKLRNLEIEVLASVGTRDAGDRIFEPSSFFYQLVSACPKLVSFGLTSHRGRTMQQAMDLFYAFNTKFLQNLSFRSTCFGCRIDFEPYLSRISPFQLKSLTLGNILAVSLQDYLKHHVNSLAQLKISHGVLLQTSESDEFDGILKSLPTLPSIHTLDLNYYPRSDMNVGHLLSKQHFPNVMHLKLKIINARNWTSGAAVHNQDGETGSESDSIHEQITKLEIDFADGLLSGKADLIRQFIRLRELKLSSVCCTFATLLRSNALSSTITLLQLLVQDKDNSAPWDSALTGIAPSDMHVVLNHIRRKYKRHGNEFRLDKFDFEECLRMCREPRKNCVEFLPNLQKLEIQCKGVVCLRITEVSLVFLLKKLQKLTVLNIPSCCIQNKFVRAIRPSLSPGMTVVVNGLEETDNYVASGAQASRLRPGALANDNRLCSH